MSYKFFCQIHRKLTNCSAKKLIFDINRFRRDNLIHSDLEVVASMMKMCISKIKVQLRNWDSSVWCWIDSTICCTIWWSSPKKSRVLQLHNQPRKKNYHQTNYEYRIVRISIIKNSGKRQTCKFFKRRIEIVGIIAQSTILTKCVEWNKKKVIR